MMNAVVRNINKYIPLNDMINYIFKQILSDYLDTDGFDVTSIEKEISNNSFLSLSGVRLNSGKINYNHLRNSPIKILNGTIGKFDISLHENNKIIILLKNTSILLTPIYDNQMKENVEKIANKDKKDNTNNSNNNKGILTRVLNSIMRKIEIIVENLCVKILTFEPIENSLDNSVLSFYLSYIKIKRDEIVFIDKDKNESENDKLFLYGMEIIIGYICLKIDNNNVNDSEKFFNISTDNNKFCFITSNNTIGAINYTYENCIKISLKQEEKNSLKIYVNIQRTELILNQEQLHNIIIFSNILSLIYKRKKTKQIKEEIATSNEPLIIFGYSIAKINIILQTEMINIILYENNIDKEVFKLFSFYDQVLYGKKISNKKELINHFCYYEDNYILLSIDSLQAINTISKEKYIDINQICIGNICVDYINYLRKEVLTKTKMNQTDKGNLKESDINSSIFQSAVDPGSVYQSAVSRGNNDSSIFQSVIEEDFVLVEDFKKFFDFDFNFNAIDIIAIDNIYIKGINDSNKQITVNNVKIKDININFHFILLLQLCKFLYSNRLFKKYSINDIKIKEKEKEKNEKKNEFIILPKEEITKIPIPKEKSQLFISIDNFSLNLFNFTQDKTRDDINKYYYDYYIDNIYPYIDIQNNKIKNEKCNFNYSELKDKDYLKIKLLETKVLLTNKPLEFNINVVFSNINLDYNSYTIASFNKVVTYSDNNNNINELKPESCDNIDIENTFNINESAFSNKIIHLIKRKDINIEVHFYEEIIIRIENTIINNVLSFINIFMFGFSYIQIAMLFSSEIYNNKLQETFEVYKINKSSNDTKDLHETQGGSIYIKGEIESLSVMINKNNSLSDLDGNLIKLEVLDITLFFTMSNKNPNAIIIGINDIRALIKKDENCINNNCINNVDSSKKDNDNDNDNEYVIIFSKLNEVDQNKKEQELIKLNICFQMFKKNKKKTDNILINNKNENFSYKEFLLLHQLPMDDMKFEISLTMINLLIYSFYSQINSFTQTFKDILSDFLYFPHVQNVELLPLCENRKIELSLNLKIKQMFHESLYTTSKNDKESMSRTLIIIDSISISQNETHISIELSKLSVFFIKNLNYTKDDINVINRDIHKNLLWIQKENTYLNRIGFIEVVYIEKFVLSKENVNDLSQVNICIFPIEANLCKDTLCYIIEFINNINDEYISKIKAIEESLKVSKTASETEDDNKSEENDTFDITNQSMLIENKKKEIKQQNKSKFIFEIIDDYYIDDKINCSTVILKESKEKLKQESERISSSGNKKNQKEKEKETKMKINLNISSFRLNLYKGKDFDFLNEVEAIPEILKSMEPKEKKGNCIIQIEEEYMQSEKVKSKYIEIRNERKRKKKRDHMNYISIFFDELNIAITFPELQSIECCFAIRRFDIDDKITNSKYSKVISKYEFDNNKSQFIEGEVKCYNDKNGDNIIRFKIALSPLNILIDKFTVRFALSFLFAILNMKQKFQSNNEIHTQVGDFEDIELFSNKQDNINNKIIKGKKEENHFDYNDNDKDIKSDCVYLKDVYIKKFFVNFSYNSTEVLDTKSQKKKKFTKYLEYMNISNIKDLQIKFKEYRSIKKVELSKGIINIEEYWISDILKNQIVSAVLHSVSIIRPITAITEGLIDIIKQPYKSIKSGQRVHMGIGRGFKNFFLSFTTQGVFLGEKLFRLIKISLGNNRGTNLDKDSYYKKWVYKIDERKRKYDGHFLKK